MYNLRPQSPQPNKHKFDQYLRKNGSLHFKPDELRLLEKLNYQKDKNLINSYELYLSDKDEIEFLDTLTYIVRIYKEKAAEGSDAAKDKDYSQSSEKSRISSIHRSGEEVFEIYSVCTLTNAESVSDGGNRNIDEVKTLSNKTPGFLKDSVERSGKTEPSANKIVTTISDFSNINGTGEKAKSVSIGIPAPITEAKVRDESSPQNNSGAGSKVIQQDSSNLTNYEAVPNAQPDPEENQENQTGQFHLSVPQNKKIDPGAFSFYKKTPAPLELPNLQQPISPPPLNFQIDQARDDKSVTNHNEFSGFGFLDDGYEKNSAAPSGYFGVINPRKKQEDSQKNSVSDNGGFAPVTRNFSDNFSQPSAPNFGNSNGNTNILVSQCQEEPAAASKPNPPPERIDYRAIPEGHMSFNPTVLKSLLSKNNRPSTIVEQKDEGGLLGSPVKNSETKTDSFPVKDNCLESPTRLDLSPMKQFDIKPIATAECSPARSRTNQESPKSNHHKNKAYLAQILRFVLQTDGADPKLAKLCSDIVGTSDTGASSVASFPADMFQFSKNKFMKSLDNYIQPILVEAIVERGAEFNKPLNQYNKDGNIEGLVQELMQMTEDHEDIKQEGSKIKDVNLFDAEH